MPTLPAAPGPADGIVPAPAADDPWTAAADGAIPSGSMRTPLPPVTGARLGPSRSQRRLRDRAMVASLAVVLSMAAAAVGAIALLQRRASVIDQQAGRGPSFDRFTEIDDRAVLLSYVDVGARALAGICVVVWFSRAYKNLKLMGRASRAPGWAIGGWFVPIMNLFRPYQMMKELARESPRVRGGEGAGTVGLWWLLYLLALIGGGAAAALPEDTQDDLIRNDLLRVASTGTWVVAGIALLVTIRTITRRQDAWFDPLPDDPGA